VNVSPAQTVAGPDFVIESGASTTMFCWTDAVFGNVFGASVVADETVAVLVLTPLATKETTCATIVMVEVDVAGMFPVQSMVPPLPTGGPLQASDAPAAFTTATFWKIIPAGSGSMT
jgi:hypothetical protein